MNYVDVIKSRRSIRSYLDKEVAKEQIEDLLEEAILAPSAYNRQPWRFILMNGSSKNWIADTMEQEDVKTKRTAIAMRQAPIIILILNAEKESRLEDLISIGGMIEQFCLSATNLGFGTLWMTHPLVIKNQIREHFNLEYELVSIIAVGYPEYIPEKRPRKELEEVLI